MAEYDSLNNKLLRGKNIEITSINRNEIEDIKDTKIDEGLSANERMIQYIKNTKNPYLFKTDNTLVKITFNNSSIEFANCMENILKNNL